MNTQFYIFLDVDGVLHPATWRVRGLTQDAMRDMSFGEIQFQAAMRGIRTDVDGLPFSRIPPFETAVRTHLDHLQIVITSSWRTTPELYDAILEAMSPDVRARMAGKTPQGLSRPLGINRWLNDFGHPEARSIVLEDDDSHAWRHLDKGAMVFLTETQQGFTEEDGQCLARLLSLDLLAFTAMQQSLPPVCRSPEIMDWIARSYRGI